ncbi:MAG: S53 family peptidase [Bryobacteraceae bacterium]
MAGERVALSGSERKPPKDGSVIGTPNWSERVEVTVILRRAKALPPGEAAAPLTRDQFAAEFGANPADVDAVEAFAQAHDLTVVGVDLARRSVALSGTVAAMNEAFGTNLRIYQGPEGTFRGRTGELFIPLELQDVIVGVFGLDNRPQARSHCIRRKNVVGPRAAGDTSYTPIDVAKLYNFPAGATGAGQTVAIIELGGGFKTADLQAYFTKLGVKPAPSVTAVSVDAAHNTPAGDPNSADGEVLLDIEVIGAIAPGAKIAVYFAPNTDKGFLDAISTAIHDRVRKPSVVSISWGGPESSWTNQSLTGFDQAFQDASVLGVSVCAASGDDGSVDGTTDGQSHVDFPSSSPHVLACGGTRLESTSGRRTNEVVWNHGPGNGASGGGVSDFFPLPDFQKSAKVPVSVNSTHFKGRGVPDVSGDADPATGYQIHVDGQDAVFGGTSAVAPLWSALIALMNQHLKTPAGYLNPVIYATGIKGFHDIVSGTNGAYSAGPGWDPCTGLGSPDGTALQGALGARRRSQG